MFLAHSSGYLWTQGAFSIDALVSIGLDSYWLLCIFGLYHALLYLLFFSYTLTPKKKKITLISRVPICQYVGFLNFTFFFLAAWETQGQPNFKPHPNFSGQPYLKKSKRRPTPHKEFLETLATIRTVQFVPEMDFNLSFEGDWDLL